MTACMAIGLSGLPHGRYRPAGVLELSVAAPREHLLRFFHALDMELSYLGAIIGFEDDLPPHYEKALQLSPSDLAQFVRLHPALRISRPLCLIGLSLAGDIVAGRAYDGIEMVWVIEAQAELSRLIEEGMNCAGVSQNAGCG
ncbi:MAG: hypothetical protein KJZ92_15785 [Rhodocyclaceae bacterium]|nr:hypothetical protein [Rhodocyclaceae bacterium]